MIKFKTNDQYHYLKKLISANEQYIKNKGELTFIDQHYIKCASCKYSIIEKSPNGYEKI